MFTGIITGTGKITTTYNEIAKKRDLERLTSKAKTEENIENYNQ